MFDVRGNVSNAASMGFRHIKERWVLCDVGAGPRRSGRVHHTKTASRLRAPKESHLHLIFSKMSCVQQHRGQLTSSSQLTSFCPVCKKILIYQFFSTSPSYSMPRPDHRNRCFHRGPFLRSTRFPSNTYIASGISNTSSKAIHRSQRLPTAENMP